MSCKDDYEKYMEEVIEKADKLRSLDRQKKIDTIEGIIGRIEGNTRELSSGDLEKILINLKARDFSEKKLSILCKCIREEGLNRMNIENIVGPKYARSVRDGLRTLDIYL